MMRMSTDFCCVRLNTQNASRSLRSLDERAVKLSSAFCDLRESMFNKLMRKIGYSCNICMTEAFSICMIPTVPTA